MSRIKCNQPAIRRIGIPLLAALVAVFAYLLFANLGEMFITDYDEARHGVNAYEMARSGDYIVSTYQSQPDLWNLKPPLSFWAIVLAYRLFGYNAFALRFFSAFSMLVTGLSLAFWLKRRVGVFAASGFLLTLTSSGVIYGLHFARYGDADAQYQLFFTLSMLCLLLCEKDRRWLYGCAVCFGLAFLEKGVHAFNIPLVCFTVLLLTGRLRSIGWRRLLAATGVGLAVVLPWMLARYVRDGLTFFSKMIFTDVAGRVGTASDPSGEGMSAISYYARTLWDSPVLIFCMILCALGVIFICLRRVRVSPAEKFSVVSCAVWFLLPVILYTVVNVKYRWYIYSDLTALPMLTVLLLSIAARGRPRGRLASAMAALFLCVSSGFLITLTVQNIEAVSQTSFYHTVQGFIRENLNRGDDALRHAYIQYNEGARTQWMQADMLTALYSGDVICLDGGAEAFMADGESAVVFLCKEQNPDALAQLMENEPMRNENHILAVFEH